MGTAFFALCLVSAIQLLEPRNMPFGVTGSSPVVSAVQHKDPDALDLMHYSSEADLIQAAERGDIYGGYIPGTSADTLVTVPAKSFFGEIYVRGGFTDAAKKNRPRDYDDDDRSASHVGPHRRSCRFAPAAHADRRLPDRHVALRIHATRCRSGDGSRSSWGSRWRSR